MATLEELKKQRLDKLQKLKEANINPYPAKVRKDYSNLDAISKFSDLENKDIFVAGRITSKRDQGKISFLDIEDGSGKLQLFFSSSDLDDYSLLDLFDLGDFIEASGSLFKTKTEQITLRVSNFRILSKNLRPLPSEHFGLASEEEKIRKRYLDIITNKDLKNKLALKTKFISSCRNFLLSKGFTEVDTTSFNLVVGGAEAEPFITHYNALDMDVYLRIALELNLKRLIVSGIDKVFEIGKVFRNEGMSMQHLQEFTMMECYQAYSDYNDMMSLVEEMYVYMLNNTFGSTKVIYKGEEIDFSPPWDKITYSDLMKKYGCDLNVYNTLTLIRQKGIELGLEDDPEDGYGRWIDRIYKKIARPNIKGPIFLIDHPVAISPLAKRKVDNPDFVERFQVVVNGFEIGNAFSELNDPIDQYDRFYEQQKLRDAGDKEAQMMDSDFIEALEYGMPPTGGFGVGLERLFLLACDLDNIRETEYFPIIKRI